MMSDKDIYDLFHTYRPELDDENVFMDRLTAQMDAADARLLLHVRPLYRRALPWAAGIAAVVAVAALLATRPRTPADEPRAESHLPEYYYYRPPMPAALPSPSYEETVDDIEASGRQLEAVIAQL